MPPENIENTTQPVIPPQAEAAQPASDWSMLHEMNAKLEEQNNLDVAVHHRKSVLFWFFIGGLISLVLASAYAGYTYYSKENSISDAKIQLNLNIDDNVKGGQMGTMDISLSNTNKVPLLDAVLTIRTQKGFSRDGVIDQDVSVSRLGDIAQNVYIATSSHYVFNGQEGDKRKISVLLEYKMQGSAASFKKELIREVKIISPSIIVNIDARKEAIDDYDYLVKFRVKNVSYTSEVDTALKIEVPPGFIIKKSTSSDPTFFRLSGLQIGQELEFQVLGFFKNPLSSSKVFTGSVSTYSGGQVKSLISEATHEVQLITSPISTSYQPKVSGSEAKVFDNNQENSLLVSVSNLAADYISDINLIVVSGDRTFTFGKDNSPDLEKINPGEKRTVELLLGRNFSGQDLPFFTEVYGKLRGADSSILLQKSATRIGIKQ